MAKVTGPLMSLDASGTVAKTATFSKWKGRNYVRQRVIPLNPQSAGQVSTRGFLGALAKAASAVLTKAKDSMHVGSQFFLDAISFAPSGQSWISYFQMIQHSLVEGDQTTYLALGGTILGYYDDAADNAGVSAYTGKGPSPVTYTKGFLMYELAKFAVTKLEYSGFASGYDAPTSTEIETDFVTYIQDTV